MFDSTFFKFLIAFLIIIGLGFAVMLITSGISTQSGSVSSTNPSSTQ